MHLSEVAVPSYDGNLCRDPGASSTAGVSRASSHSPLMPAGWPGFYLGTGEPQKVQGRRHWGLIFERDIWSW
jgi:hypothetical protein